jgi:type IV secretory pathway ATPase VirB11/archaellum biosynthesis ATPase
MMVPGEATLRRIMEPMRAALSDPDTREVVVNKSGEFGVENTKGWSWHEAPSLTFDTLDAIAILAARFTSQDFGKFRPACSSRLPDGERITMARPPVTPPDTINLTIRKRAANFTPTLEWMEERGWFNFLPSRVGGWPAWLREQIEHKRTIIFTGETGSSKAQPLDAKVLTPTGWRCMGDLSVGDLVACPDGASAPITGVYPQGEKEIHRVTFEDGRSVECCDDHLWKVWNWKVVYETGKSHTTRETINNGAQWAVLPLKTIRTWFEGKGRKGKRAAVPLLEPFAVELPPQDLPVPPYALGALLGDGHLAEVVSLSTADPFILERTMADLPEYEARYVAEGAYDYRLRMRDKNVHPTRMQVANAAADALPKMARTATRRGHAIECGGLILSVRAWAKRQGINYATLQNRLFRWRWPLEEALGFVPRTKGQHTRSPLMLALEVLGLAGTRAHQKFVPEVYKRGSAAQRVALLQGLLDTDGAVCNGTHASFGSASERLAKDVQELAWSVGAIATITEHRTSYTYKGEKRAGRSSFRVSIVHPDVSSLFSLPRKVAMCKPKAMRHRLRIASIERVGLKPAQCIRIDHPDHLYITNNYVVTHNTTAAEACIRAIPLHERIITLESTPEWFGLPHKNWAPRQYAQAGDTKSGLPQAEQALATALRERPDRILFGEMRTGEAWAYLRVLMGGHPGGISTAHAAAGREAAFDTLTLQIRENPHSAGVSDETIRRMLREHVHIVVHCEKKAGDPVPYRATSIDVAPEIGGEW